MKAAIEKRKAEEALTKHMKIYEAQNLTDKNSRTLNKIMQLLEIIQGPDALKVDPDGHVLERIEKLKKRYLRRLAKLTKWADAPEMERIPGYHSLRVLPANRNRSSQHNQQTRPPVASPVIMEPQRQSSRLSFVQIDEKVEEINKEELVSVPSVPMEEDI